MVDLSIVFCKRLPVAMLEPILWKSPIPASLENPEVVERSSAAFACVSGQVKTFYISMHGFKGTSKGNHMAYGCFNHKGALKRQTWQQRIHGKSWTDCKRKNVALPSSKTNITMSHWWMMYWFRMVISIAMLVYQRVVAMKDPRFRMSANSSKIAQSRVLWKWGNPKFQLVFMYPHLPR